MRIRFAHNSLVLFYLCFFFTDIVLSELTVRVFTLGIMAKFPIFMILFAMSLAILFTSICVCLGEKARKIFTACIVGFVFLITAVQLVYHNFCSSYMSIVQVGMGGAAFETFGRAAVLKIFESLGGLLILSLPIFALVILTRRKYQDGEHFSIALGGIGIVAFLTVHFLTVLCLPLAGSHTYDPACVYSGDFDVQKSTRHFGSITTLRLEVQGLFFGKKSAAPIPRLNDEELKRHPGYIPSPITEEYLKKFNITDIDFNMLQNSEVDPKFKELHDYFASVPATPKNEYTGYFEGYNLIFIACESFSHHVINPDLTPNLYKLSTEGFVFSQYYNTICDNTSNGEYALLTSLVPDTSLLGRGIGAFYNNNSLTASKNNFLPFCIARQFSNTGANTYAIHYHTPEYYGRMYTHPNLGYNDFFAFNNKLEPVETFPTSDIGMMEQAIPEIVKKDENGNIPKFHAYFLTFSGHMPYDFDGGNDIATKNREHVEHYEYSDTIKAYLACQLELEYAIENLLERLKQAGVLENTVIAITNDHYPYELGTELLSELSEDKLDPLFDKYSSCFILWSPKINEPIRVDVPCCSLDVLPTLSNLWGFEYDSRLLMGKDVFADTEHIALLSDKSFITDKVKYNCTSGEVTVKEGIVFSSEEELDEYILDLETEISNRFRASRLILEYDYYRYIYAPPTIPTNK